MRHALVDRVWVGKGVNCLLLPADPTGQGFTHAPVGLFAVDSGS